jgi:hypothetical protein
MRIALIIAACGLALAACSKHDESQVKADAHKAEAQINSAARKVGNNPDLKRAGAEVKHVAAQAGAAIKSAGRDAHHAVKSGPDTRHHADRS